MGWLKGLVRRVVSGWLAEMVKRVVKEGWLGSFAQGDELGRLV